MERERGIGRVREKERERERERERRREREREREGERARYGEREGETQMTLSRFAVSPPRSMHRLCIGCQTSWCILLHGIVCTFSHQTHLSIFAHPTNQ